MRILKQIVSVHLNREYPFASRPSGEAHIDVRWSRDPSASFIPDVLGKAGWVDAL